jgi:hypothetical protein
MTMVIAAATAAQFSSSSRLYCRLTQYAILISFALILVFEEVDCFKASSHFYTNPRMNKGITTLQGNAPKTNGDIPKAPNTNDDIPKAPRRRKRSVDYPKFAYQKNDYSTKKERDKKAYAPGKPGPFQLKINEIKYTVSGGLNENERVIRTPKAVLVPPKVDAKSSSLLDKLFISLGIGRTFEPGLTTINKSASSTRLLEDRAYALPEPFAAENLTVPPSLEDLAMRPRELFEGFWISTPARLLSFGGAYAVFPLLTKFLNKFVTIAPEQLDEITSKFSPGISILYGTFVSLTLSILYTRQRDIQANVALESSYLVLMTRNLLSVFKYNREKAIEAGQCSADQIRTLVRSSRGAELMLLMYSDPYARMLELLESQEEELFLELGSLGSSANLLASTRDILKDLNRFRANRLSDEALALPPTHFLILNILTILILVSYTISILPTVDVHTGEPSLESSLLFGVLSTVYVLFYNFASDLNNPFRGVYQIRRSCAASHLLEAKWLIANHPLLRGEVDFEEGKEEPAGVLIRVSRSIMYHRLYFHSHKYELFMFTPTHSCVLKKSLRGLAICILNVTRFT